MRSSVNEVLERQQHVLCNLKGLVPFLSSDKEWKPVVTKAIELQADPSEGVFRGFRLPDILTVLVLVGLLVNIGISAALYMKVHSLEAQLATLNSIPRKVNAAGDAGKAKSKTSAESPKIAPDTSARAPENELEKSGPLTIEKLRQ